MNGETSAGRWTNVDGTVAAADGQVGCCRILGMIDV